MKIFRTYELEATGPNFSPHEASARSGLTFESIQEPGAPRVTGPEKGRPSKFGFGRLAGPRGRDATPSALVAFLEVVESIKPLLTSLGADQLVLHHNVPYGSQCNIEWPAIEMRAIARLQIPFTVSCWIDEQAD